MKLWILCKNDVSKNPSNDEDIVINCGICKGMDTLTPIRITLEDYKNEIEEIVYPECDILKNVLSKNKIGIK